MYLNCHTYYSLRYGTLSPEQLVEDAVAKGVHTLALTDINSSQGMLDFVKLCNENNVKPIAGVEFRNDDTHVYTGIALNNEGFRELNEIVTLHSERGEPYPAKAPRTSHSVFIYPFGPEIKAICEEYEFIGIRPSDLNRLQFSKIKIDASRLVMMQPVTFKDTTGFHAHRYLRAIDHNTLITKLQPHQAAMPDEIMLSPDALRAIYADHPQIIKNTEKLLSQCSIAFDYNGIKNRKTFTGNASDDRLLLEKLAFDGLEYRYGKTNRTARERVLKELAIIDKLGFSSYFLITWDIIRYSMSRGFYHVGRGSGANSIVAYCLKITEVDPIELDLYFERFINPKRSSPPDFDIDYSWKERDEVIDYIFKRYGSKHTALLGATSTFRDRSTYRELGKVVGLPKAEIDELVKNPEKVKDNSRLTQQLYALSNYLADFPNIRSIHAGGILISEEPMTCYTALDMPPKGFPTTQWDMYVAEDFHFEKLDILSQRGIGHIRECADIIYANKGVSVDIHRVNVFKKDKTVKKQLKDGETIGCFYVESPAMRGLLKKLRCDNYLTLVAASSIIRPGVARSGMMREYIKRFHDPKGFSYIHPVMEEQLKETFGVMVYQEDVLKVCHHFAGLDLADADVLRRAMSGKVRGKKEMQRIVNKFFENCRSFGYPENVTKEVWRQIESFAGYSFSKAHSASYAAESFQSLYLKAHYPHEFMVAVINNFGGYYRTWVYFNEAKRCGATIKLPCVNAGNYITSIHGKDIYIGFIHIANLEAATAKGIESERRTNGTYSGLDDFIARTGTTLDQMLILIKAGAFGFTGKSKPQLYWEVHLLTNKAERTPRPAEMFHTPVKKYKLPALQQSDIEDAWDEIELMEMPVTLTWFDLLKTTFRGEIPASELIKHVGKTIRMIGQLVTIKYVKTIKNEWMHFGTFIDVHGEIFDTVHFPNSLKQYPFKGNGLYLILGKVTEEFDYPSITVDKMEKLPVTEDPRRK
ncbi:MAG: DNA polymerase III subunit alpha [Bacteroidota bacterium]